MANIVNARPSRGFRPGAGLPLPDGEGFADLDRTNDQAPKTNRTRIAASGKYIRRSAACSVMIGTKLVGARIANTQPSRYPTGWFRQSRANVTTARITTGIR